VLAAGLVAITGAALVRPGGVDAHPLGNFTVNHYAGIELAGSRIYMRFVLDLAEIPTYQEGGHVRSPAYAAGVARELELRVDGTRARLVPVAHRVSSRPGAGASRRSASRRSTGRHSPGDPCRSPTTRSRAGSGGARSPSRRATAHGS
jgi:hypothetical protein